jgi:predicted phosphate transport protein (TIGR00153 family)
MATTAARPGFFARLLPASGGGQFFDLFEQHAERAREGAVLLAEIVRAPTVSEPMADRVKGVEHLGDEITHTVIERLHQTFITPMDRDDIHRLISRMDDVLDLVWASAERIWLYRLKRIEPEMIQLADVLVRATQEMGGAVRGLRDLRDRKTVIAHCTEINRLENEGDAILRRAVARLFENGSDPIHVIKCKEIYDNLENAIDRCEDVANVIEGVALEYS